MNSKQRTVLIFEPLSGGHRANFIGWLKNAAPTYAGCRFIFFTADDVGNVSLEKEGWWEKQKLLYRLFRQACTQHNPDHVLILELTHLELPLILFGSPIPLSAILFVQYSELPHGLKFFYKHWNTRLLLWRVPVKNLFLLNGENGCRFLTKHFGCTRTKFIPIPDPVLEASAESGFRLREHFDIPVDRKIFLFFGSISRRKGADVLLEALSQIGPDVAAQGAFVFCGAAEPAYQRDFQRACDQLRSLRSDVMLCVEKNFVSDERMMAFFEQSDVVLMPYTRPEYSSGILALSAKAGKPVLGPPDGLLGRLITENCLGVVSKITPNALAAGIPQPMSADEIKQREFSEKSSPAGFSKTILDTICNES